MGKNYGVGVEEEEPTERKSLTMFCGRTYM